MKPRALLTAVLRRRAGRRLLPARVGPGAALAAAIAATWLGWASPAAAFSLFGYRFFESDKPPPSPDAQPYTIDVAVTSADSDVQDLIKGASQLWTEREDTPPPSTPAFLSRARAEYERIEA